MSPFEKLESPSERRLLSAKGYLVFVEGRSLSAEGRFY